MSSSDKAWIITAEMGYGHERAASPLHDLAYEKIFTANSEKILSTKEHRVWYRLRTAYEILSRLTSIPFLGKGLFRIFDKFMNISALYPFRDLSMPTIGVYYFEYLIKKFGLCSSIIEFTKTKPLPMVTTYFVPALAADLNGLDNIYCVVTDTDINRVWVQKDPKASKIIYLAPCKNVVERLFEYGVDMKKIILTGFPLPKENIGFRSKVVKSDLARRLAILDPNQLFYTKYKSVINKQLGIKKLQRKRQPITITFCIGGAGAQKDIAIQLMDSLKIDILKNKVRLNIMAGLHYDILAELTAAAKKMGIDNKLNDGLNILYAYNKKEYFISFNKALRTTDILWTKPSELSFYSALGLPIIIAPPIGSHEEHNKRWLLDEVRAGIEPYDIKATSQWLFDRIQSGNLAEAAWNGFMNAPINGTYNIERLIQDRKR